MMMSVMVRVVVVSSDVHNPVAEFLYANRPEPVKCSRALTDVYLTRVSRLTEYVSR